LPRDVIWAQIVIAIIQINYTFQLKRLDWTLVSPGLAIRLPNFAKLPNLPP